MNWKQTGGGRWASFEKQKDGGGCLAAIVWLVIIVVAVAWIF